ncbi:MAG: peptidoglycan DD-metalloendopeptidase family protein [Patescibacteria group bacterium]|nr:peptidoglycan DD-metalloendopeptidase family protein [Patescibacteria group bacterium]
MNKPLTGGISAFLILVVLSTAFFDIKSAIAEEAVQLKNVADELNAELEAKKSRAQEVQGLINSYKDRIKAQEAQKLTLENQIVLLDNRIREKELREEEVKTQIEILTLELQALDRQIVRQEGKISTQKALVGDLVRRIRQADDVNTLHVFLSRPSLSSYFQNVEELTKLEGDLTQTLERVVQEKTTLQNDKVLRESKRITLTEQKKTLLDEQLILEMEKNSKKSLLAETESKQSEFSRVVSELRQQDQATSNEIYRIEKELKDKLDAIDLALASGETLLSWPVPLKKITATFHDPTYPFRNIFEHPGIDLRAGVGTPIRAAGGGYVAWTKTGRSYGNYIMVVHAGNIATLYAHLSKFNASPGTYVERGDIIGYSGGMPGTPGAGLSTGPHLHFEVRQDGIPVDPQGFLPIAIETDL